MYCKPDITILDQANRLVFLIDIAVCNTQSRQHIHRKTEKTRVSSH